MRLAVAVAFPCCTATHPPNGPAALLLVILTMQTFVWPATVPVQIVPAGIATAKGCSKSDEVDQRRRCTHKILINVGSSLHQSRSNHQLLPSLGRLFDVAIGTWDLGCNSSLNSLGEIALACGINHGCEGASAIRSDDVECAGNRSIVCADLGQS